MADASARTEQEESKYTRSDRQTGRPIHPAPVRRWTLIILGICIVPFLWYVVSDRLVPYTDQARVQGFVVQIAPRVSGTFKEVNVRVNQIVEANDLMLRIDPTDFELAVQKAEADLEAAGQEIGANTNAVDAATVYVIAVLALIHEPHNRFGVLSSRITKLTAESNGWRCGSKIAITLLHRRPETVIFSA